MFDHPYICLDTEDELCDESLLCWMRCVKENGPPGILASTETVPNGPQLSFYKRSTDDTKHYIAVLARNLSGEEATEIAKEYSDLNPSGDFTIHWSQEPFSDGKNEKLEDDLLKSIVLEAAKLNHNQWARRSIDEGWRYSTRFSMREKTNPMCRDWDQLPDAYKKGEIKRMVSLLEVLDRMNLIISRK